jgi:hypothetical protein
MNRDQRDDRAHEASFQLEWKQSDPVAQHFHHLPLISLRSRMGSLVTRHGSLFVFNPRTSDYER